MPTSYPPYPPGFGQRDVISRGTTGLIVLDAQTQTIIRWPENDRDWQGIQHERQVYEQLDALGGHEGLLGCYGCEDTYGLRLEYTAYRDLQSHIRYKGINQPLELQWMIQVARVLEFIHRHGVIHGSVALRHVMLDAEGNAALGDFAWCSMRGSGHLAAKSAASHEYPGDRLTVQGDLFAFGSAMYELVTGMEPFVTLRDEDIRARFRRGVFPDVAALGALGAIISKCWTTAYENTKDVVDALEGKDGLVTRPQRAHTC
ncbi:Protein kinase-like domain protein [Cordyceps fumosorosea ARSEF 2679]|uniref:Protein kinase-like domain protein n=1 Tax=Cordyceps fumosorosea (strain ARSEF 2679) TaxID=1081104 RepID=A0A167PPD0_CORFA|nr:Protein kinase-like domain protein [Cordyceps fumosorosea ARSEF 2679]OAA56884.1 Protein kinase-like domain protein [Cordyceps fumosorosea ARSEF 2679]